MLYEKGSLGYFLELARKDGFNNLRDWNIWRKENGKMKSLQDIETERVQKMGFKDIKDYRRNLYIIKGFKSQKEYEDYLAKKIGFDDKKERNRFWHYDNGSIPMSENIDSGQYLGIEMAERRVARMLLPIVLEKIEKEMPYGNPGFDFICHNNQKIDIKSTTLNGLNKLSFHIRWNNIPEYFMLVGFNNREELNIIGIWMIKKGERLRYNRSSSSKLELYKREGLSIKFDEKYLKPFRKYEITNKWKNLGIDIKII